MNARVALHALMIFISLDALAGPGSYNCTSSLGKQDLSQRPSVPLYGFGTVDREKANRVFISRLHAEASYGRDSPGPGAMRCCYPQLGELRSSDHR